jgi:hypothetical protein
MNKKMVFQIVIGLSVIDFQHWKHLSKWFFSNFSINYNMSFEARWLCDKRFRALQAFEKFLSSMEKKKMMFGQAGSIIKTVWILLQAFKSFLSSISWNQMSTEMRW